MAKKATYRGYFTTTDLAKEFHITKDLIRDYVNQKLLSPTMLPLNKSQYSSCDKIRLKFIIQASRIDYSMQQIEELIGNIIRDDEQKVWTV